MTDRIALSVWMLSICEGYFGERSTLIADDVSQALNLPLGEPRFQSQLSLVAVRFWKHRFTLTLGVVQLFGLPGAIPKVNDLPAEGRCGCSALAFQ